MRPPLIALVLLFATTLGFAWNEPDSFVGIKWGDTPATAVSALRERSAGGEPDCKEGTYSDPGGVRRQTNCRAYLRLGDVHLTGNFRFGDAGFFWAFGTFLSEGNYALLSTMFTEKYGTPTRVSHLETSTPGGVKRQNEIQEWVGDKVVIRLFRFGFASRIDEGSFEAVLRAENDKRSEYFKAREKEGRDKL